MTWLVVYAVDLWAAFAGAVAETSFMGPPRSWLVAIGGWLAWPLWPFAALFDRYS